jgi:hypothetical protein
MMVRGEHSGRRGINWSGAESLAKVKWRVDMSEEKATRQVNKSMGRSRVGLLGEEQQG